MPDFAPFDDDSPEAEAYDAEAKELIHRSSGLAPKILTLGVRPETVQLYLFEDPDGSYHPGFQMRAVLTEAAFEDTLDDDLRQLEEGT